MIIRNEEGRMGVLRQNVLQIKGIREGLLVSVGEGDWADIQAALIKQIEDRGTFFQGARLAIDVGSRVLHAAELGTLRDKLADAKICLWAVVSKSTTTEQTAQVLGLVTQLSNGKIIKTSQTSENNLPGEEAVFIQKTLRSGSQIACDRHVVVFGDVNPGAEIQAGGNIIVWGRIKGSVHAGADGNTSAVVCGLEISPLKLRIANLYLAENAKKKKNGPETARIHREQVILELWKIR